MKISETPIESVKKTLRIDYNFDDDLIEEIMESAKGYLVSETALSLDELDNIPEMTYAFKCVCASMYDNREMTADNIKPNPTAEQIIAAHRRNYI